jgi:hypothetical protein
MLIKELLLVVVTELNVVGVAIREPKADAPLIVDRNGVLPRAIALEGMQAVAGRHLEIGDLKRGVDGFEFAEGAPRDVGGHLLGPPGAEELLGLAVGEGLDHARNVTRHVTRVNAGSVCITLAFSCEAAGTEPWMRLERCAASSAATIR